MSTPNTFADLLISAVYTIVIALTPYIICKFARKNISSKFAKKFTIIFSIVSFLVFCIVGFITNSKVTVNPAILWNVVGYLIIAPKKEKNTTPADFSNEPFFRIEKPTKETNNVNSNKQNVKLDEFTIANLLLNTFKKSNLNILFSNEFSICDSVLFCRFLFIHTLKRDMLDKKININELDKLIAKGLSNIYGIKFDKCCSYFEKRSEFYNRIFAKADDNISIAIEELKILIEHDIVTDEFVEFNENSPIMLTDFDKSISIKLEIKQLSDLIIQISKEYIHRLKHEESGTNEYAEINKQSITNHTAEEKTTVSKNESKKSKMDSKYKKSTVLLSIATVIFMLSTVVLSGILFFSYSENNKTLEQLNDLETTIKETENSKEILRDRINALEQELDEAYEKIRIYEGRPSSDEIQEKLKNDEYDYFDSLKQNAKENDRINWEKEKNSAKPDLDVEWN